MNRLVAVAILVAAGPVAAESVVAPPKSWLQQLLDSVHEKVDAAIIAKPPKLVPPKPVKLGTKLVKLATLDIGGSLSALTAVDLDGNGKAELYAVTPTEVVAIGLDKKPRVLGRVAFSGATRNAAPRDVVASVATEPGFVLAAASGWQKGIRASWQGASFVAIPMEEEGFPQCQGQFAPLVPGRNFYGDATNGYYGIRCSTGMVDSDGYPLRATAKLSLQNKLDIAVDRCAAVGLGCQSASRVEHTFVGTAFEIADLDRDGKPELVSASAVAPGDPDVLRIVTLGQDEKKPRFKKAVAGGGIAGIVYADVDGNGSAELVIAVRMLGAPKVDLWRLE